MPDTQGFTHTVTSQRQWPNVPATLLGRLAVSENFRGQGIGELLLLDALQRALGNIREVASAVVVVDAKDERARGFYLRHDFVPLPTQPNRLFYPTKTIEQLFNRLPKTWDGEKAHRATHEGVPTRPAIGLNP